MKLPKFETIIIEVTAGSHIVDVSREAIAIAVEHCCDVQFTHNDRVYRVKYTDLYRQVAETKDPSEGRRKTT